MRQIAKEAGVAVSTVSKALRNDRSIPEERCVEIQAIAERLGYRPNPMVATLMAQLHHHRRRSDPHNIAWIDLWPSKSGEPTAIDPAPIFSGARERAQELGYGVEIYSGAEYGMDPERLRRTLLARGHWGVIIPPVPDAAKHLALDLRGLAAVTIGTSLHEPVMHRVSPNHFQGCALAFGRLREMNYRRIGLVLSAVMDERVEGKWLGALLASQQRLQKSERVTPLIFTNEEKFSRWLCAEKPDVLLRAERFEWESKPSCKPVSQPPTCWLMQQAGEPGVGCLDYHPKQLGRVAMDTVMAQIHRNDSGSPAIPQTILIDASWEDLHPV
jgi:LacI family transcriptional regulator